MPKSSARKSSKPETCERVPSPLQAALEASPANVAALDESGKIVAANRAWLQSQDVNGFAVTAPGLGADYFKICELAPSSDARRAASGIRQVLRGQHRFALEYSGGRSESGDRWRMTVTRFADDGRVGAIVAHSRLEEIGSDASCFEDLLADLSATFVRIAVDQIDREIEHWLGRIGLTLDVDRASIAQRASDDRNLYVTHQWAREGFNPIPIGTDVGQIVPWMMAKLFAGEILVFTRQQELPPEAAQDVKWARSSGRKSFVGIPLKVGDAIVGAMAFASISHERAWPPKIVQRLRLVAEVFGNALERKRTVIGLRRLQDELRQASRATVMGELTASLAHELNQPLGAILSNAQAARHLLEAARPNIEESVAALDDIIRDDARAVEIIRNVRALFRRGEVEMGMVDLGRVLSDVERILRAEAISRNILLRLDLPPFYPTVFGNRVQLMELLMNLALNAFDAVSETVDRPREVEISVRQCESGQLRIAVSDSGPGIAPEVMPRLFEAFFTTKRSGMGMGLAIARSIAESHAGRLWAAPHPDRGATLVFELPLAAHEQDRK